MGCTGGDTGLWAPSTGRGPVLGKRKLPSSTSQVLRETLCREQRGVVVGVQAGCWARAGLPSSPVPHPTPSPVPHPAPARSWAG